MTLMTSSSGAVFKRDVGQVFQDARQARPAQKWHAEPAEAALRKRMLGEKRHDVRVPQPGQGQVFVLIVGDDLHDDRPVGQCRVGSQKGAPGGTSPELGQQQERAEDLAGFADKSTSLAATGSGDRTRKRP